MRILVCFKVMPNWDKVLEQDWEDFSLDTNISYAGMEFNCFDQSALELGLRIKDKMVVQGQNATCTAVTVGKSLHDSIAQNLYSIGYDEVINIENIQSEFASDLVADTLASYARNGQYDLILTGSMAGMAETGMVPILLAEKLGLPMLSNIETASACDEGVLTTSHKKDGLWEQIVCLPVLLSVGNSPAVLRCSTLRARMAFKGHSATHLTPENNKNNTNPPQLSRPEGGRDCKMLNGEPMTQVEEVLKLLQSELNNEQSTMPNDNCAFKLPNNTVHYKLLDENEFCVDETILTLNNDWNSRKPDLTILPDTELGRLFAVKLATKVGCNCMTKSTIISATETSVTLQKRACASNLICTNQVELPAIITTSQVMESITKVPIQVKNNKYDSWLFDKKLLQPAPEDKLKTAKLVFVCGSGMGSKDTCDKVRHVANKLDAGFGLTRPAALNSWGSTSEIIGQSGKIINPCVCIALGTAGAGAFLLGIENSSKIIAVNTDLNALIFKTADLGLQIDATNFIDMMLQLLEGREI